jgi:Protein of unknown function (DUF3551)
MTRIALAILFIAALLLEIPLARAAEGRWCAITSSGQGGVREDCQYASIEACRQALQFDRGSCTQNPRWSAPAKSTKKRRKN